MRIFKMMIISSHFLKSQLFHCNSASNGVRIVLQRKRLNYIKTSAGIFNFFGKLQCVKLSFLRIDLDILFSNLLSSVTEKISNIIHF